ncbi:HEAT repeat domain-containing protein [Aneurinibacillus tyrosinisolvens]|uniref:HEAT repeat domain-containing protein n=1 Tax=Aneurinibacillus tyrosinisolvens TaxID=1443435 RepID=UPI00063F1CCC|nr:HEAT repeat domain-containing protein [Aneurinibacillus tyrosinisolvens]
MDLEQLQKEIEDNNIEEAISMIEEIGRRGEKKAVPFLIQHLKSTDNHGLRNQIALALSDMGNQEAVEPIIEMITHSKTLGNRGTLLYALKPLDYSNHIELLVDCMVNGNYEVQHEAKQLIMEMNGVIPDETLLKAILKVQKEIKNLKEKHDFLLKVLGELHD